MNLSRESKYRLKKICKVVLWTVVPYILIKIPQELLKLPNFAECSWFLNVLIYAGKTLRSEPTKNEMKIEGV